MAKDATSRKKASIIVPCYNVEQYLPRCIESLLVQTLPDIEIICINDGSPDNCLMIMQAYQEQFPDTLVIIDKPNEGVWRGRFDAIKIARGEYIGFVDSDDHVEPDFAEKLYIAAKESDADIAVCGFNRVDVDSGKVLTTEMTVAREPFNAQEEPARLLELNGAPWNKFFRAEILKQLHDMDEPPKIFDDMMMHLLAFPSVNRVVFTPHALVNYIIRGDSIMTTIDKTKIDSAYEGMREVKKVYETEASVKLQEFLAAAAFLHLGLSLMFRLSYDQSADLKHELSVNRAYLNEYFPAWDSDTILSAENARRYKGAVRKTYYGREIYRMKLMPLALQAYRALIRAGIDIKW